MEYYIDVMKYLRIFIFFFLFIDISCFDLLYYFVLGDVDIEVY